jgi:hypothetical protein
MKRSAATYPLSALAPTVRSGSPLGSSSQYHMSGIEAFLRSM